MNEKQNETKSTINDNDKVIDEWVNIFLRSRYSDREQHVISSELTPEEAVIEYRKSNHSARNTLAWMANDILDVHQELPKLSPRQTLSMMDKIENRFNLFREQIKMGEKDSELTKQDVLVEKRIEGIVRFAKNGNYSGRWMEIEVYVRIFKGILWRMYEKPQTSFEFNEFKFREQISDAQLTVYIQDETIVKPILQYIENYHHATIMSALNRNRFTFRSMTQLKDDFDKMEYFQQLQAIIDQRRPHYKIMQEPARHGLLKQACDLFQRDYLYDWEAHAICNADYVNLSNKFDERKMHQKEITKCNYISLEGKPTPRIRPPQIYEFRNGLRKYQDKYEVIEPAKPKKENYKIRIL